MQVLSSEEPLKKEKLSYYSAHFVRDGDSGKADAVVAVAAALGRSGAA